MRTMQKVREFGSDFHYSIDAKSASFLQNGNFNLFFSGRSALYSLIKWGINHKNWQNVYFPSYYCHEVEEFINDLSINIGYYEFNPFYSSTLALDLTSIDQTNNVFVSVNYFGLTSPLIPSLKNAVLVEDVTHDLEKLYTSSADYCFASLRKILPLPCGGCLYSRQSEFIPTEPLVEFAENVSLKRLEAMMMKAEYLKGKHVDKEEFRQMYISSEKKFSDKRTVSKIPISSQAILNDIDPMFIIEKKKINVELAMNGLLKKDGIVYNQNNYTRSALGLIIQFQNTDLRNKMKSYLIENKVFPAILWPHQLSPDDQKVEQTVLFVHLDFRYDEAEIIYLVNILNNFTF